jgi:predicted ATPase
MKIRKFSAVNLNGYINFRQLHFDPQLTFLVGINGSGKTSLIRAIMALITPDVDWLMTAAFEKVSVEVEIGQDIIEVHASKSSDGCRVSFLRNGLAVSSFDLNSQTYTRLVRDREEWEFDDDVEPITISESYSRIPDGIEVFDQIKRLPTPIFLGLDRTTLGPDRTHASRPRRIRSTRRMHPTIRSFLDESVAQAEALALEAQRSAQSQRARLASKLREDILLSLFRDPKAASSGMPRHGEAKRHDRARRSLKEAFSFMGLPADRISAAIDPFYSELIGLASVLSGKSVQQIFQSDDQTLRNRWMEWQSFQQQLYLVNGVDELVSEFNRSVKIIFMAIRKYEDILNSFFFDSKKKLRLTEDFDIELDLPSGKTGDVYFLSSGERQLFVLITALMFNDDADQADLVIIDEPELSLHIKWQESFVGSLMDANPHAQLIMATHSPSIISGRQEYCVSLV